MSRFFIIVEPGEVNARLAIYGGKILAHLPNYLELYPNEPVNKDSGKQVFAIFPDDKDVNRQIDGGKAMTYLWRGDKGSRQATGELVSVPILPVDALAKPAGPADLAKAAFSDLPEPIRLAGVISAADPALLASLPTLSKDLPAWASKTVEQFVATAK